MSGASYNGSRVAPWSEVDPNGHAPLFRIPNSTFRIVFSFLLHQFPAGPLDAVIVGPLAELEQAGNALPGVAAEGLEQRGLHPREALGIERQRRARQLFSSGTARASPISPRALMISSFTV